MPIPLGTWPSSRHGDWTFARRLLINHSLPPLSYLPRNRAGRRLRKEAIFTQGVETNELKEIVFSFFFNTLLVNLAFAITERSGAQVHGRGVESAIASVLCSQAFMD